MGTWSTPAHHRSLADVLSVEIFLRIARLLPIKHGLFALASTSKHHYTLTLSLRYARIDVQRPSGHRRLLNTLLSQDVVCAYVHIVNLSGIAAKWHTAPALLKKFRAALEQLTRLSSLTLRFAYSKSTSNHLLNGLHFRLLQQFTYTAHIVDQTFIVDFLCLHGPTLSHVSLDADIWTSMRDGGPSVQETEPETVILNKLTSWFGPTSLALSIRRDIFLPLEEITLTLCSSMASVNAALIVEGLDAGLLADLEFLFLRYWPVRHGMYLRAIHVEEWCLAVSEGINRFPMLVVFDTDAGSEAPTYDVAEEIALGIMGECTLDEVHFGYVSSATESSGNCQFVRRDRPRVPRLVDWEDWEVIYG